MAGRVQNIGRIGSVQLEILDGVQVFELEMLRFTPFIPDGQAHKARALWLQQHRSSGELGMRVHTQRKRLEIIAIRHGKFKIDIPEGVPACTRILQ